MSRYIPENTKRRLLEETQFRCAFCLTSLEQIFDESNYFHFAENAHVTPHSQSSDNSFENLICLCPNCHKRFDKNLDKEKSVSRLKELKKHWFVVSGNFSKLEIDCLFSLHRGLAQPWIQKQMFTTPTGVAVQKLCFSVPSRQSYLFQSLINKKLVQVVEQKGAFSGASLTLGAGLPAEDTLWLFLTEDGVKFCDKFNQ